MTARRKKNPDHYDCVIVGAGPAGLSAALILARCRRRIAIFDDNRPRNYAARAVNGYLGRDGVRPPELRRLAEKELEKYAVKVRRSTITKVVRQRASSSSYRFKVVEETGRSNLCRRIIIATGMRDCLPEISNLTRYYGRGVYHCPYCDGWENRDKKIVVLGSGKPGVNNALSMLQWSGQVRLCTSGTPLSSELRKIMKSKGIGYIEEEIDRLEGDRYRLRRIVFRSGKQISCDAFFFSSEKLQQSALAVALGCKTVDGNTIKTEHKQISDPEGIYIAGDADGDVQFAIVAAAEGAIAATAVNKELTREDYG